MTHYRLEQVFFNFGFSFLDLSKSVIDIPKSFSVLSIFGLIQITNQRPKTWLLNSFWFRNAYEKKTKENIVKHMQFLLLDFVHHSYRNRHFNSSHSILNTDTTGIKVNALTVGKMDSYLFGSLLTFSYFSNKNTAVRTHRLHKKNKKKKQLWYAEQSIVVVLSFRNNHVTWWMENIDDCLIFWFEDPGIIMFMNGWESKPISKLKLECENKNRFSKCMRQLITTEWST